MNWLFELRNIADYGGIAHVSEYEASQAVQAAECFLRDVSDLLES